MKEKFNKKNILIICLLFVIILVVIFEYLFIFHYKKEKTHENNNISIQTLKYVCEKDNDETTIQNGVYVNGVLTDNVSIFLYHVKSDVMIYYYEPECIYKAQELEERYYKNKIYFEQQKEKLQDDLYFETDDENMVMSIPYDEEVEETAISNYLEKKKTDGYTCKEF